MTKMSVESYFLRYAFPCTSVRLMKKEITQEEFDKLREAAVNMTPVARSELEKVFYTAFEELERLAREMQRDKWDFEVVRDYFLIHHNRIIDQGRGLYQHLPESMREFSKVFRAKVVDIKDKVLIVEYDNGKETQRRNVISDFVPEAGIDDFVMIHYGYAIEPAD
jgi:hypothetical protein